ncbi:MAG: NnrU family protein [Gammaproteobacteria bacterium]|nr:NnrU family protein [Gammaproteobacteria bacterium]
MIWLIAGMILFFGVHSIAIVAPAWRGRMLERLGEGKWKGIYSLLAAAGLVLLIYGYGQARQQPVVLYTPPFWTRHVAALLLLPVFPMLFAAYLPGRIRAALKHPMLAAVKLWALAHLIANGMLADVLLFGGFLVWAVADRISLKRRPPKPTPAAPPRRANDAVAVVLGLAVYGAFVLWLHGLLIGVPLVVPGLTT